MGERHALLILNILYLRSIGTKIFILASKLFFLIFKFFLLSFPIFFDISLFKKTDFFVIKVFSGPKDYNQGLTWFSAQNLFFTSISSILMTNVLMSNCISNLSLISRCQIIS